MPKKELSGQNTNFSQAEIRYESGRVPFDQMKVSKKNAQSQKKLLKSMIKYGEQNSCSVKLEKNKVSQYQKNPKGTLRLQMILY